MKKIVKYVLTVLVIGTVVVISSYWLAPEKTLKAFFSVVNLFTSKPAAAEESEPKATYKSSQLLELLSTDSSFANKIKDQNIAVEGTIKEVKATDHTITMECGESAFINFSFDSLAFEKSKASLLPGTQAAIKGIYVGYDFPAAADDGMSLLPPEKNIFLKLCFVHHSSTHK